MAGNLLLVHLCQRSKRIAIVGTELRRIVPFVDLLHEFIRTLLGISLGWHVLLRPFLAAFRARRRGVIPIVDSPFTLEILNLHVLITFPHENPPRLHVRRGTSKVGKLQAACHWSAHEVCPPWVRRNDRNPPQRQRT